MAKKKPDSDEEGEGKEKAGDKEGVGPRFKKGLEDLDQLKGIEKRQDRSRKARRKHEQEDSPDDPNPDELGPLIDDIEKSRRRLKNRFKDINPRMRSMNSVVNPSVAAPMPEEFKKLLGQAIDLKKQERYAEAAQLLEKLRQVNPTSASVHALLADALWEQHDLVGAISAFRRAIELSPKSEMASLGLFHTLLESGEKAAAVAEMHRYLNVSDSEEYNALSKRLSLPDPVPASRPALCSERSQMPFTVFYSWQTDRPEETNKSFLREVIKEAIAKVSTEGILVDSPRFESGMEGVSGTPEVATVMFDKIDSCAIFIGDVTIVAKIGKGKTAKCIPNPNVSLELGYAAARIGWGRVICVMNEAFGKRDQQPFDVRNRRYPIDYTLDPDKLAEKPKVHKSLVKLFVKAIIAVQENEHRMAEDARDRLDADSIRVMRDNANTFYFHLKESAGGAITSARKIVTN